MDNQRFPVRVFAAGLPLIVIALVFGAIGYVTTTPRQAPIPPLADAEPAIEAARGEIVSVSGGQITLVTEAGEPLDFALPSGVSVETLRPIELAAIQVGDWLNGGAIPHPETVLALVSLILLPEPVIP